MKKLILSLTTTFCVLTAFTQITVTASEHNPSVGDQFTQQIVSSLPGGFNAGPSGEDVTWDFSSLEPSSSAPVDIESSSNADFPEADIFFNQQGTNTYFGTGNNAFTFYGTSGSGASIIYTDGQDQMRFPFTYGDSYSDTYSGTIDIFGQNFDREGTVDVTSDGYGTLITPEETFSNALRIQIVRNAQESTSGQVVTTTTDTIYFWYEENISFPIATYFRNYSDGQMTGELFNYLGDGTIDVQEQEPIHASVYPNPASEKVQIKGLKGEQFFVEVLDLTGKIHRKGENLRSVDVSELETGIYLIRISMSGDRQKVLKLIKD
ncbi:T9SS type A sorting domain-containing protein [Halocola ammonii]